MTKAIIRLVPSPLTAEAFAAYGQVTDAAGPGGRVAVAGPRNLRPGVGPRLGWFHAEASTLPLRTRTMERHRFSSQTFLPPKGAAWLLLVAPHGPDGGPALTHARAFIASGTQAVTYAPDTWHHPLVALDQPGLFAVLTFLDDSGDDEEFVTLPAELLVARL